MGALVGLGVGVGLLLIWAAFALPRQGRDPSPTSTPLGRLLGVVHGRVKGGVRGRVLGTVIGDGINVKEAPRAKRRR